MTPGKLFLTEHFNRKRCLLVQAFNSKWQVVVAGASVLTFAKLHALLAFFARSPPLC
jgi:hypothetical protein